MYSMKFALLLIAASICMGGYCLSECWNGTNWCWYRNNGGQPGKLVGQLYPVPPTATPSAMATGETYGAPP